MAEKDLSKFNWIESHSLEVAVEVKIISLQGNQLKPKYESLLKDPSLKFSGLYQSPCADLLVECQVFSNGAPISLPVHTSYKAFTTRWNWSEWMDLGIYYSVLPRDAKLALTIYDCAGPTEMRAVGGTTISLFKKFGLFREGTIDLQVWLNQKADGSLADTTPGKPRKDGGKMHQLAKLTKKYRNGEMKVVEWMDRLSFREIEKINERERANSEFMYLTIEFGQIILFDEVYNVVYYEQEDDVIPFKTQNEIVKFPDPEIGLENLVEKKHHILSRSARSGISDKDAKPNAAIRDTLISIVNYPPTKQLTSEEQDLMWKFRFYLSNQKKACVKFLECVNWKLPEEAKQALDLLAQWAPMGVEDALRLLSPRFQHASVRKYAVARLQQASDEDLLLYLLQLVQALKYENFKDINSRLKHLNELVHSKDDVVSLSGEEKSIKENADVTNYLTSILTSNGEQDLAMFLISRACRNFSLANYFYWYLMVECEDYELGKQDNAVKNMYLTVMNTFLAALQYANAESQKKYAHLKRQRTLIDKLVQLVKGVARENANRKKKIEYFQSSLKDVDTFKFNFANFEPLPFPLDPNVLIKGVIAEKATLFNSKLMPSKLTFVTTEYTEYVVIFKHGDDLRQDQLVLQIITLMDKLLRSENLDLKLTPYRVLAISSKHGFVQFVDSVPVAEVLTTDGSIQNFFKKHHPSESGLYGIASDIMDTYVKSCAGYCVITYLLGVGDRHFDNLLLTTTGKLFHIDFGYILGRDPKPLPPPMKLSREMVEAMGGPNSEHYAEFRKLCYTAFLHLRRHSNLILNLFALMADASVPDIALEPDKAVIKVQDKFRLDLGDEEAVRHFQNLLDASLTAVMAPFVEHLHKIAQYWRT